MKTKAKTLNHKQKLDRSVELANLTNNFYSRVLGATAKVRGLVSVIEIKDEAIGKVLGEQTYILEDSLTSFKINVEHIINK